MSRQVFLASAQIQKYFWCFFYFFSIFFLKTNALEGKTFFHEDGICKKLILFLKDMDVNFSFRKEHLLFLF
jgi:hypothetical protein